MIVRLLSGGGPCEGQTHAAEPEGGGVQLVVNKQWLLHGVGSLSWSSCTGLTGPDEPLTLML